MVDPAGTRYGTHGPCRCVARNLLPEVRPFTRDPAVPASAPIDRPSTRSDAPRVAIATSAGLRRIRHLERFLGVETVLSPGAARRRGVAGDVVLVWGRRRTARRAETWARRHGLPVWHLEDGWIRTCERAAHAPTCYSLLVDPIGVYYDSAAPSAIETFLNRPDEALARDVDAAARARARECRRRIVAADITKYNWCPTACVGGDEGVPLVLVIDQTRDDASVRCGGLDEADFVAMLEAARVENPGARIVVRTHPDVVAGRRAGYLGEAASAAGIELSAAGDNPLPWLKRAARVYVGTSQIGYEALLCERPVTVFGRPFYAGWGLTDDRVAIPRRRHRRDLDELFHAAHVRLARYCSPIDGSPWTLERCLDHVELQKAEFARNAFHFHGIGVTAWKRRYVARFLRSPDGSVRFGGPPGPDDTRVCWSYRADVAGGTDIWRMEDGFLRSAGLGSDFTAPGSLVIDTRGMYFDASAPSDLEILLNERDCTPVDVRRAARLRRALRAGNVSKYNIGASGQPTPRSADTSHVLIVGQVEGDESIRRGSPTVRDNAMLVRAVRSARPGAWITYRPHPDVRAGNRPGRVDEATLAACVDSVDADSTIGDAIDACDELHAMTSLAGFEALLRGRPVVAWGAPFYAGWGLTEDRVEMPRRTRRRTLDELVHLTLIEYPRYVDIASGEFVTAEDMIDIVGRQGRESMSRDDRGAKRSVRTLDKALNIYRGLRYAP